MRTPFLRREAGSLINRTVTIRTIADFRHPRTGSTALLLSTTTELFITDLVSQHDPQANPQLACHRHTRLPHTLLHQLATIETFQLRITACGMSTGLIPKKAQQRITLFGDFSEPPASPAGAFLRNEPHVAGQRLTIAEPLRVAQKHIRGQRRNRPHSGMRHKQLCSRAMLRLLGNLHRAFRFLRPYGDTELARHSVAKSCVAAGARTRFSLARHSSIGWDRVAIHSPRRWPAAHFVPACADAPIGGGAATRRVSRAVPGWASKSPESDFRPTALESARRHGDRVSACEVPPHGSSWRPPPGMRFPVLPADLETTAWVQWLRCPPAPGAEARNKTPALHCLRAAEYDSPLLRLRCRAWPASAGERANHIL